MIPFWKRFLLYIIQIALTVIIGIGLSMIWINVIDPHGLVKWPAFLAFLISTLLIAFWIFKRKFMYIFLLISVQSFIFLMVLPELAPALHFYFPTISEAFITPLGTGIFFLMLMVAWEVLLYLCRLMSANN